MRTGSNLLRVALESSPQVVMRNEIFNHKQSDLGQDFDSIISNMWRRYPRTVKAVGCKIFYHHLSDAQWVKFQGYLDFRIIHLTRRNQLRVFTSKMIAIQTEQWIENHPNMKPPITERRVTLDKAGLIGHFRLSELWEQRARQRFEDKVVLEICYEDLVANFQGVVATALEFVGAKEWSCNYINLRQQNPEALRELIINFDELKCSFSNTAWQAYFDEEG